MTGVKWDASTDPQPMLEFLRGKATDRKLQLVSSGCCRRIWQLLTDAREAVFNSAPTFSWWKWVRPRADEGKAQASLLRCIFGPLLFRPIALDPLWLASPVPELAESIYVDRAFDRLPLLADALEDAGCTNADILNHCRQPGVHTRGCWVVDLLLGKS